MKTRTILLTLVLAGAISIPASTQAQAPDRGERDKGAVGRSGERGRGDRDRTQAKDDKQKLKQTLKTGEEKDFYRRELEKMGWQVTAVNHDKPDYVEYEIVKGDSTYEVQIDFDTNSHKATKVEIATNLYKADATEKALRGERVETPKKATSNASLK
jgi:hypothetical protein